jgi:RNA recognition motif-containing protein
MSNRLYVGNLPYSTTSSDLQQIFAEYGSVASAHVITDRETGRSRGFGFVEMDSPEAFRAALEGANGRDLGGRQLSVTEARERPPREGGRPPGGPRPHGGGHGERRGPRPGGGGGGGGGGGPRERSFSRPERGGGDSDRGRDRDESRRRRRERSDKRRDDSDDRPRRQRFRDFPGEEDFG